MLIPKRYKKTIAGICLALFLFVVSFTAIALPTKTQAVVPATIVGSIEIVMKKIADFLYDSLVTALLRSGMNTLQYLTQRIAYDAALFISSGGSGQSPLVQYKNAEEYFKDLGGSVAGELIGDLNKDFSKVFNLCSPESPNLKLTLKLGLLQAIQPPPPKCDIYQVARNWKNAGETFGNNLVQNFSPKEFTEMMARSFEPNGNDLGLILSLTEQAQFNLTTKVNEANLNRGVKDADWQDLASTISKRVTTPRSLVKTNTEEKTIKAEARKAQDEVLATYITGAVRPKTYPSALLATFTSTFINTLGSQMQKRLMEGLFKLANPSDQKENYSGVAYLGRAGAEASFADIKNASIITEANVDYVSEFGNCPQQYAGINNCVIDSKFQTAILQYNSIGAGLTIREAMNKGLLRADWPIYPKDHILNKENNGMSCYKNGYCYRNLQRLRKSRIISVGWEMVSELCNKDEDTDGVSCSRNNPPTLGDVVNNFYNCDPNSKDPFKIFCHLIDPNWVLKAPATQCLALVSGPLLEGGGVASRQDICVDDASCIVENDNGECQAFGYCTREKNIWRLGGERCEARFDSCRIYSDSDGNDLNVIDKTIDPGVCTSSNAGCLWYSSVKKKIALTNSFEWSNNFNDKIYLNGQAKECDESSGGCNRFIKIGAGLGSNLLINSSFEINLDTDTSMPDGWQSSTPLCNKCFNIDGTKAIDGDNGVSPGSTGISQQIEVLPKHSYVASVYALNSGLQKGDAIIEVILRKGITDVKTLTEKIELETSADHERFILPFNIDMADGVVDNALVTFKQSNNLASIWFDGAMFEELGGDDYLASSYAEYGTKNTLNLKKAPDYLGCYTNWGEIKKEDICSNKNGSWDYVTNVCKPPQECSKYASWCSKEEVGCNLFKPVKGDSPAIAGTPFTDDFCPGECSGYSSFIEQGTLFEKGGELKFLIPSTAKQCNLESVGCDEFTNLEAEETGKAEVKEYYSFLRQCKKPDQTCKTFYTWEGSDTDGYQLRTFTLESELNKPKLTGTTPDTCDETKFKSQAYPDCRQFYYVDEQGKTHISYSTFSRTKVCSDECTAYRRTLTKDKQSCEDFGGTWSNTQNYCVYLGLPSQSRRCSEAYASCREYKGNTGNNTRLAMYDDFESGSNGGWDGAENSNVAPKNFLHSITNKTNATITKDVTSSINSGYPYTIKFSARSKSKTGANLTLRYSAMVQNNKPIYNKVSIGSVNLDDTWKEFTLGPVVLWDDTATNINKIELHFSDVVLNELYVDTIEVREINERVFLVKDSWKTPVSCDNNNITPYGRLGIDNPSRDNYQAQLNCREYKDNTNVSYYLKSFTQLCRTEAVGCEALIDTKNNQSPFALRYNVLCDASTGTIDIKTNVCTLNIQGQNKYTCTITNNNRCYIEEIPNNKIPFLCSQESGGKISGQGQICGNNGINNQYGCVTEQLGQNESLCYINDQNNITIGSCKLQSADKSCYIQNEYKNDASEVIIEKDNVMYLVNSPDFRCQDSVVGCKEIAKPKLGSDNLLNTKLNNTERWESVWMIDSPDNYKDILCNGNELFCKEFIASDNSKKYFKDPTKRTCEYRENVKVETQTGTQIFNGWFKVYPSGEFAEPCYESLTLDRSNRKDVHNKIVGSWDVVDQQHNYLAPYLLNGSKNPDYKGWVGLCPESQNMCTLFVDPSGTADTTQNKEDISHYFYIKDEKLDTKSCNGQVSLGDGCVLFNDTTKTSLTYHSGATYKRFDNQKSRAPINPIDCSGYTDTKNPPKGKEECKDFNILKVDNSIQIGSGSNVNLNPNFIETMPQNDSNIVLKVKRDRTCGEWLACKSSTASRNNKGELVQLCNQLSRCTQYNASTTPSFCSKFIPSQPQRLTVDNYQKRGGENYKSTSDFVTWTDSDYSGYSIPNYFGVDTFIGLTFKDTNTQEVNYENRLFHDAGLQLRVCTIDDECNDLNGGSNTSTAVCLNNRCVLNINGTKVVKNKDQKGFSTGFSTVSLDLNTPEPSCRAYPEREAPYPSDVLQRRQIKDSYASANICEDCEKPACSYSKYTYGNQTNVKYLEDLPPENGVCVGGPKDGQFCDPYSRENLCGSKDQKSDAVLEGKCEIQDKRVVSFQGWEGYCLERDYGGSRSSSLNEKDYVSPCLTWMPVKYMSGLRNIYENYETAGLNVKQDLYYCAEVTLGKDVYTSSVQCSAYNGAGVCNNGIDINYTNGCRADMYCQDGYFIAYGNCNSWGNQGGQDAGFCNAGRQDNCPFQCVPMGAKHVIGGKIDFPSSMVAGAIANKDFIWEKGDSCWDTATRLATKYGVINFGGGDLFNWYYNSRHIRPFKEYKSYYAFITVPNIEINDTNYGFAPLRKVKEDLPIGRTIFDDCILPNVDIKDTIGQFYSFDSVEGEIKLMCKTLVKVNNIDEKVKKGQIDWLSKAWTDRVAYNSTKYKNESGSIVAPYQVKLGDSPLTVSYLTPGVPMSFSQARYFDIFNNYKKKDNLNPFISFTNNITGCRNSILRPTYFGVGVQKIGQDGIDCIDSAKFQPIAPLTQTTNNKIQNQNQDKIKFLFAENSSAFYKAEFMKFYEVPEIKLSCGNDNDCKQCINREYHLRLYCETDSDCKKNKLDFGTCTSSPYFDKKVCSIKPVHISNIYQIPYICQGDIPNQACITRSCKVDSDCTDYGDICESKTWCKKGEYFHNSRVARSLYVGFCIDGTICKENSDCEKKGTFFCSNQANVNMGNTNICVYKRPEIVINDSDLNDKDNFGMYKRVGEKAYDDKDPFKTDTGVARLQQIYAKVYEAWRLTPNCDSRDKDSSDKPECKDITTTVFTPSDKDLSIPSRFPQFTYNKPITGSSNDDIKDKPFVWDVTDGKNPNVKPEPPKFAGDLVGAEAEIGTVMINGTKTNAQYNAIEILEGTPVTMSFYGWADKNQMPLRKVVVSWGEKNNTTPEILGKYRNRRAVCNVGDIQDINGTTIPGKGFGGVLNESCEESPFIFSYVYSLTNNVKGVDDRNICEKLGGKFISAVEPKNKSIGTKEKSACEFILKVHMEDNWGWCTGSCENPVKINGCYNKGTGKSEDNLCDIIMDKKSKAWIPVGTIRVFKK